MEQRQTSICLLLSYYDQRILALEKDRWRQGNSSSYNVDFGFCRPDMAASCPPVTNLRLNQSCEQLGSYTQCHNFAEAERLLRICLEIMKTNTKPDDQCISFPLLHLAATLYHLSRDEEAEEFALEALRIREKAFGKDSAPTLELLHFLLRQKCYHSVHYKLIQRSVAAGEALDCLISIQGRLGKADSEILDMLKEGLKIQEREFGSESEVIMLTLKKILFYLDRSGRKDEKFPIQRRLALLRYEYEDML